MGNVHMEATQINYRGGSKKMSVEDELDSLRSGLTNYESQNNLNLEVPDRKNVLPMTVNGIKALNTTGSWNGNDYTVYDVTFTIQTDSSNNVIGIKVNGTSTGNAQFILDQSQYKTGRYTINGCPAGGNTSSGYFLYLNSSTIDIGAGATGSLQAGTDQFIYIGVRNGCAVNNAMFYPMIRPATITDATFAPYIPSVESRIEAVEEFLPTAVNVTLDQNVEGAIDDAKVFRFGKLIVGNIRVTLNNTVIGGSPIIHGLPKINTSLAAFSGLCPVATNKTDVACTIFNEQYNNASLGVATGVTAGTGVLMLSFSYVSV